MKVMNCVVCTWNLGRHWDYLQWKGKEAGFRTEFPNPGGEKSRESDKLRLAEQRKVDDKRVELFQPLISRNSNIGIWCLQEVGSLWERISEIFSPDKFGSISDGDDSAIVWDKSRFVELEQEIQSKDLFSIVQLQDTTTLKKICVISVHLFGGLDLSDGEMQAGNDQFETLMDRLGMYQDSDFFLIGMDANTPPEYRKRLEIATNRGFYRDESDVAPTFAKTRMYPDGRKIDYLLAKESGWFTYIPQFMQYIFFNQTRNSFNPNHIDNPSDHKPVAKKITFSTPDTFLEKITCLFLNVIGSFLSKFSRN